MLGQQFVIDNRGGAGGTIGEAVVAKADPDGYTMLYDATAFSVNPSLYPNLSFDYSKDFEPVFLVSLVPNILVVTPSVPVKTVADVIALRQGGAGRPRLGVVRQRHAAASVARNVPASDRHQDQPHALSRRRSRAQRRDRRSGEILLLERLLGGRPDPGRQGQGDRAYRQGPARDPAGYAAGVRHAARLRGL